MDTSYGRHVAAPPQTSYTQTPRHPEASRPRSQSLRGIPCIPLHAHTHPRPPHLKFSPAACESPKLKLPRVREQSLRPFSHDGRTRAAALAPQAATAARRLSYDELTTGYGNALDRLVAKAKRHQVDCLLLTDWAPVHRHKSEPTEPQRRRGALRKWYSW